MHYIIWYEESKTDGDKSTTVDAGTIDIYHAHNEAQAISEAVIPLRERARLNGTEITLKMIETRQKISIPIK